MANFEKLLEFLSKPTYKTSYADAKANGTCIMCRKPAKEFSNASARLEYNVSALCQKCQEEYFNKEKKLA
ncbi:MAG: hypothetical protein PVI20_11080 [Desulfobacteraceae bacterium]|jgi:hypothetical protein